MILRPPAPQQLTGPRVHFGHTVAHDPRGCPRRAEIPLVSMVVLDLEGRSYRQAPDCVRNTVTRRLLSALRFPFKFFSTLLCLGSQTGKTFHRQVANELRRCEGRIVVRLPKGTQYTERLGRIEIERPRQKAVCVNHLDFEPREDRARKVDQVVGDDMLRAAADRRCQDMAVSASGSSSVSINGSYPVTSASGKCSRMACRWERTLGSRSGFCSRRLAVHSSRIRSVHRARNIPAWWKRKRMSRLRNGDRTFASSRATRRSESWFKTHRTPDRGGRAHRAPLGARRRDGRCRPSDQRAGCDGAHRPIRTGSCPT